jgi:2-polyprenyl-6-hydroxyphenyl methylase/3-demethylubiquinone-9 3-methyltransferase
MFEDQVEAGERFRFGENWSQFLELLDDRRISEAEDSIAEFLGTRDLAGRTFLDIGSGSGLFSLAARRLGARVHSIDFDPLSVACTQSLKERFFRNDPEWEVTRGSVLDPNLMSHLAEFDVVYSWGVLHHTGEMHRAIRHAIERVAPKGVLHLALYRKTWFCPLWKLEKRLYCASPRWIQRAACGLYGATIGVAYRVLHRGRALPRGMDLDRDIHDWLGGYPYESITPKALKAFVCAFGFVVRAQTIKSEGMHVTPGCDEFTFQRA